MSGNFPEHDWNTSPYLPSNNAELSNDPNYDTPYPTSQVPPPIELTPMHLQVSGPYARPRSSPSTFGPNFEDLLFPGNPFRHRPDAYQLPAIPASPITSNKPPSPYFGTEALPPITTQQTPPLRAGPIPIAPDPIGLQQMHALKRMREEEEWADSGSRKRRRAPSQAGPIELNEEEQLLLKLKDEENLPWKDIAVRFQEELGRSYQVPALQMRFKRLRERMRYWSEADVQALEQAYDYWERFQFDIIAAKMLDYGATERWPAKYCARKWGELHPERVAFPADPPVQYDPWDSEQVSPVEPFTYRHSPGQMGPSEPVMYSQSPQLVTTVDLSYGQDPSNLGAAETYVYGPSSGNTGSVGLPNYSQGPGQGNLVEPFLYRHSMSPKLP